MTAKYIALLFIVCSLILTPSWINSGGSEGSGTSTEVVQKPDWAIVIHGGAGVITRDKLTHDMDNEYRSALEAALADLTPPGADVVTRTNAANWLNYVAGFDVFVD